jgi:hypothetical protein
MRLIAVLAVLMGSATLGPASITKPQRGEGK